MSQKKRILVVDDDPDFCDVVQSKLEALDVDVELAYDGVEGMAKVRDNPPDVIVLDVMMPEKDGFQMCKEIKQDPSYQDIPVIMLTAVADHIADTAYSQYDAMSMEAEDYIPKGPDCSTKVVQSVQEFL
ncbi:MAG: response regulator [Desulfohalobiaceae bacterium]|nr:response regulator [Desulfohalobiaceae bacterium]